MLISKRRGAWIVGLSAFAWTAFWLNPGSTAAGKPPDVRYANGLLSLSAENSSLLNVLRLLSETAGIEVSVSAEFIPGNVSIRIADQPLEQALKQILKGANYAVIYLKEGDSFRITEIKVYPEGRYGGEMVPISAEKQEPSVLDGTGEFRTVLVSSGQEVITHGSLLDPGRLAPARSTPNFQDGRIPGWFVLQKQPERQEALRYEELLRHKLRVGAAENPDRKEALAAIYADEVARFYEMKKAHLNKIEALKRITDHNTMTSR